MIKIKNAAIISWSGKPFFVYTFLVLSKPATEYLKVFDLILLIKCFYGEILKVHSR